MKKILSAMLAIVLLVSSIPMAGFTAFAAAADDWNIKLGSGGKLTRAEWIHNLVYVFEMVVEEESLPDNYYADLKSNHKYYEDILLAIEFGVIDIEEGGNIYPDGDVSRDFAVSTLNYCLGYQLEEGTPYSFSDYADCSDPDSAQIAVDRKWVNLIGGKFYPDLSLTSGEAEFMLDDAIEVIGFTTVDENYDSKYTFADDVIVIEKGTEIAENEDGSVSITNCPVAIGNGDKVAVFFGEIPLVYLVESVSVSGNVTTFTGGIVETDSAYEDIDAQGTVGMEGIEIIPVDDAEVTVEYEDVATFASGSKKIGKINVGKTIQLATGVNAYVTVQILNPKIEYNTSSSYAYVALTGDTVVTYGLSMDFLAAAGLSKSLTLFTCNVGGVGSFDVTLNCTFCGSASGTVKGFLTAGIEYSKGSGFRAVKSFSQSQYYSNIEANASLSIRATLGVTKLPIIKAYVYAEIGAKGSVSATTYGSGTPKRCTHFKAWLFARFGASASVKFLKINESVNWDYDIFKESNSPVRIVHHYEDGNEVPSCTRGAYSGSSGYFTHGGSSWGGSGWSGGNGAYGLNADGSVFKIYNYTLDEEGNATITKYNGNSWSVYIPSEIDGHKVTAIGSQAFQYKKLSYVSIPSTVTSIGYSAFAYCYNLSSVDIPSTVTSIDSYAFQECALTSFNIPTAMEVINSGTFEDCYSLRSITIPDNITEIGHAAFRGCVNLKDVKLSKNLSTLYNEAFSYTPIESIEIPKSLKGEGYSWYGSNSYEFEENGISYTAEIGNGPFYMCENLKNVTFEKGTTEITEILFAGCVGLEKIVIPETVTAIEYGAFYGCVRLKDVTIGSAVTLVDTSAFNNCVTLPKIDIPNSVTEIGHAAFRECVNLKDVKLSKNLSMLYNEAFSYTPIESIEIPKSLKDEGYAWYGSNSYEFEENGISYTTEIGNGPFYMCENLKNVTFEKGTTEITEILFAGCVGLEKIVIPDTVTVIEKDAFYGCVRLKDVTIGSAVTLIDDYAFYNCVTLPKIDIPNSVTEIGHAAFRGCVNLKDVKLSKNLSKLYNEAFSYTPIESIEIPKSLKDEGYSWYGSNSYEFEENDISYTTEIGNGPFYMCENLKNVTFEKGTTEITEILFAGCVGLEKIVIPDTVTAIERDAFYGCVRLKDVTIGSAVTLIDDSAFYNCVTLPKIDIPNSVTEIGGSAFAGCISLKNIVVPDSVAIMDSYCFDGCSALESAKLPNIRQNVSSYMFRNCTSLKTISLPASVQNIQYNAFYGCTALESIEFPKDSMLTEIGEYAFYGCSALKEIAFPEKTKNISNYAFQNCVALEKVTIPQSTKTIGNYAFKGCEALKDLIIADYSIKTIGSEMFKDCPALEKVVLPKGLTTIGSQAFVNCTGLKEIYIPESVTSINSNAFSYPEKMAILGKAGSYAETFATNGGFTFKDASIPVEGILLKGESENIVLEVGETYRAEFEVYPEDANEVVVITSDNNKVTIDGHDIYARYSGDSVLTATSTSGLTYEFNVHNRSVSKIEIARKPDKMSYVLGEEFDKTGMLIRVHYNDNTTKFVEDYTVTGFDSSVEGINKITIKWVSANGGNYSTTTELNIVDTSPKLTGIFIDVQPTKLYYALREKLDTTGMVVKGNYTDNVARELTGYTVSGYNALKTGAQTITVTYGDFKATFTVTVGSSAPARNGWVKDGAKWTYYKNGTKVVNNWVKDGGKWYFMDANGYMLSGTWKKDSIGWVYLGSSGYMMTNAWVRDTIGWCYVGADGYAVTNTWMQDSKGWCYLNSEGSQAKNTWVSYGGKWYFVDTEGYMVTNVWKKDSTGWVYLGSSGYMMTNAWVRDSIGWCYVGANGYAVTNTWKMDSKGWCYLGASGSQVKNNWVLSGGKWYFLDAEGYMVTGTHYIDGKYYTFNSSGVWVA